VPIDHATRVRVGVLGLAMTAMISTMALAQEAPSLNYTSFEATSASPTQIGYYGTANKDCSPAQAPRIRVVEPPKAGTFTVRPGELTTTSVKGCSALKLPARVLFYQARVGAMGSDHFVYEVTDVSGAVSGYDVTITIREPPKKGPAPNSDKPI